MSQQTYNPLPIVTSSHDILHLDYQLKPTENDFGVTYNSRWNSYTQSLLPIPMLLATLGLLALIILNISLLTRAICGYCKCAPGERYYKNGHIDDNVWVNKDLFSMNRLIKVFYVSAFLAIILDQALFIGNQYITQGVNEGIDNLNSLSSTFTNLDTNANTMDTSSSTLSSNANQCGTNANAINSNSTIISQFSYSINSFLLQMSDIPSQINSKSDILSEYGTDLKNRIVWILYGAVILVVFSYEFGLWNSNKKMLQISIFISQLLILAFIIICAFEMMTVMLLADFCVNPAANSLQLVNPSATSYSTIAYYTSCNGSNPLSNSIQNMTNLLSQMNNEVNTISTLNQCSPTITSSMQTQMNVLYTNYYAITNNTQCALIQSTYTSVLYENICSQTFSGLFIIWTSEYLTIAFVFLATITASIIYQLFGRYWDFDVEDGTFAEDSPNNSEFREEYVKNNFNSNKLIHQYNDMHNNNKHHASTLTAQVYDENGYDGDENYNNNTNDYSDNYNNNGYYNDDANYNTAPFPISISNTVPQNSTLHLQQPPYVSPGQPLSQPQLSSSQRSLVPLQYNNTNRNIYANNDIQNSIDRGINNNNTRVLSEYDNIDRFYENDDDTEYKSLDPPINTIRYSQSTQYNPAPYNNNNSNRNIHVSHHSQNSHYSNNQYNNNNNDNYPTNPIVNQNNNGGGSNGIHYNDINQYISDSGKQQYQPRQQLLQQQQNPYIQQQQTPYIQQQPQSQYMQQQQRSVSPQFQPPPPSPRQQQMQQQQPQGQYFSQLVSPQYMQQQPASPQYMQQQQPAPYMQSPPLSPQYSRQQSPMQQRPMSPREQYPNNGSTSPYINNNNNNSNRNIFNNDNNNSGQYNNNNPTIQYDNNVAQYNNNAAQYYNNNNMNQGNRYNDGQYY